MNCEYSKKNRKSGVTLAEILIASAILSLVLLAASALMVIGLRLFSLNTELADTQAANRISMISITRDIRMLNGQDISEIYFDDSTAGVKELFIGTKVKYRLDMGENILYRTTLTDDSENTSIVAKDISDINVQVEVNTNKVNIVLTHALNNQIQETTITLRG